MTSEDLPQQWVVDEIIFLKGLPEVSEYLILEALLEFGRVLWVRMMRGKKGKQRLCFARLDCPFAVEKALKQGGIWLKGDWIEIQRYRKGEGDCKVFAKHIPSTMTAHTLSNLLPYAPVNVTPLSPSLAVLLFESAAIAQAIIRFKSLKIGRAKIVFEACNPRFHRITAQSDQPDSRQLLTINDQEQHLNNNLRFNISTSSKSKTFTHL